MAERDIHAEMETLKSEMAKLRTDFSGVIAAMKSAGKAEAEAVREGSSEFFSSMKDEIRHALEEARKKGKQSVEAVEKQVGEHPFLSLLAAFGAGFIIAKLLDRK